MKKTFKPMARTERASHVYKKKTLNVNDELNIRHDDDDLENVDDYWSTAVSVIGNRTIDSMDDTVITEQSDTLFDLKNIRRSVKGDMPRLAPVKDLYRAAIDNSNRELLHKEQSGGLVSKKRLTLKPEENDSDEYVDMSAGAENKENSGGIRSVEIGRHDGAAANGAAGKTSGAPASSAEDDKMVYEAGPATCSGEEEAGALSGDCSVGTPDSFLADVAEEADAEEGFDIPDTKRTNKEEESEEQMARNRIVFSKTKPRRDPGSILIQDVRSAGALNKVKPLVCTDEINTAIMELDFLAYTNEEGSEKAFSIFVIRGSVEIQAGSRTTLIKKGEATVIGEGDVYSLNCKSRNGASLFLSYAL